MHKLVLWNYILFCLFGKHTLQVIFLNNQLRPSLTLGVTGPDNRKSKLIVGFDTEFDSRLGIPKAAKEKFISDLFMSLLLHDQVAIRTMDILYTLDCFPSFNDFFDLIKTDSIKFIEDSNAIPCLILNEKQSGSVSLVRLGNDNEGTPSALIYLETRLKLMKLDASLRESLIINVEKRNETLDYDEVNDLLMKEIKYDLKNKNLTNAYNITSTDIENIKRQDALKVLRLLQLDFGLITSNKIDCDNILLDGGVKNFLSAKIPPLLANNYPNNEVDLFSDILAQKKIPDLGNLYLKGVITIGDFIEYRKNGGARKFRQWVKATDYKPEVIMHEILKSKSTIDNNFLKFFRWFTPTAIGFGNPLAGMVAGLNDSFLVDKFINGWHPNLYLDNYLKSEIDKKIAFRDKERLKQTVVRKFPKTGRNDPCPCESKKKFKNCCGK